VKIATPPPSSSSETLARRQQHSARDRDMKKVQGVTPVAYTRISWRATEAMFVSTGTYSK